MDEKTAIEQRLERLEQNVSLLLADYERRTGPEAQALFARLRSTLSAGLTYGSDGSDGSDGGT